MARFKDVNWSLRETASGQPHSNDDVTQAILMDLRDELKRLNVVFACERFQCIPHVLDQIRRNTTKRRSRAHKTK